MKRLLAITLAGALAACGSDGKENTGGKGGGGGSGGSGGESATIAVMVDPAVAPQRQLPGIEGEPERPLAAAVDEQGHRVEFVANEALIVETTEGQAKDFVGKHGGEILESYDLDATTRVVRVRVNAPVADVARLPAVIKTVSPDAHGELHVSSEAAAKLLAAIGAAGVDDGLTIMPNPVLESFGVDEHTVTEAPTGGGGWNPDITELPGFASGDAQDIGVADAWRMLSLSGRDANRVRVAILDQGFSKDADLDGATAIPATAWGRAGTIACSGGGACPWHGTGVAQITGGLIDNAHGAAGTGGQVADLILAERFGEDFFEIVRFLLDTLPRTIAAAPKIVNMSFGSAIPAGWYALTFGTADAIFAGIRAAGTLLLAAAGNDGRNVDAEDCIFGSICWENDVWIPCENAGVTCIGGVGFGSTQRADGSNFGSRKDRESVELYAPYWNWVGPDPDNTDDAARLIAGTSGATPFVAGVAAMVWAADPSLSVDQVERTLFETAHTSTGDAFRLVNARGAVKRALGGNAPPFIRIVSPADGATFTRGTVNVEFAATVDDEEGGVGLQWSSSLDGVLSTSTMFSSGTLSVGVHTIRLTATDGPWTIHRTVNITVNAAPPVVEITAPASGPYYAGSPVSFGATAYDPSERMTVPDANVSWHLGSPDAAAFATGYEADYTFPSAGNYTVYFVAVGSGGRVSTSIRLLVDPAPKNTPPVVTITLPAGASYDAGYPATSDASGYYWAGGLKGTATDAESGTLMGTWSKRRFKSGDSYVDFASGNAVKSEKFYVDPGQPSTTWEVRFQASDGVNPPVSDTVLITVHQLI